MIVFSCSMRTRVLLKHSAVLQRGETGVCVCGCVCVCMRERVCLCGCVCGCMRERVCLCLCVRMRVYVCYVCVYL